MTRTLPAFSRTVLLLLAVLLLGTAVAQDPLAVPDAPTAPEQPDTTIQDLPDTPSPEDEPETATPEDESDTTAPEVEPETEPDTEPQYAPTVQPVIPPDSLGRFDPFSGQIDVPPAQVEITTRYPYIADKIDPVLSIMLEPYLQGLTADAETVTRDYYLRTDAQGRYLVTVLAAEGVTGKTVAQLIKQYGGKVQTRDHGTVYAKLQPELIALLSNEASVALIQPQVSTRVDLEAPTAFVRNPVGNVYTEGFDVLNTYTWHQAGNRGSANVEVAVIDFGFGNSTSASSELSCLNSYPSVTLSQGTMAAGDTTRGLEMAEVICDIAPQSRVRLYKATTANALYDAITLADNTAKVILIGTDFGAHFSPGDGTFGRSSAKNVYEAISLAKANGVTVIAAAGNANQAYTAFTFLGTTVTITLKVKPGDTVSMSWDDWEDSPHPSGGAQDDIVANLSGGGFTTISKPARAANANPSHQFTIPSCNLGGDGFCNNTTLTLVNFTGGTNASSLTVQVSITGGFDRSLTVSGATELSSFGTISRPADSPDVIAVGAVCTDYKNNFPGQDYSGTGPAYSTGGRLPEPPADPMTAYDVKPDVVGPANVSVSNRQVTDIMNCNEGLRGTQAGAAHIAGMTALLLNGNATPSFKTINAPSSVIHYLRTHSIDLPLDGGLLSGDNAPGYDYVYGAGLPVLGMPDYNYDASINAPLYPEPNLIPAGECTGGFLYVGPRKAGSSVMSPHETDYPYQSIMQAAYRAALSPAQDCVIVLPGEYSSPLLLSGLNNDVGIYGYQGVSLIGGIPPSTIVTQNRYYGQTPLLISARSAGVYVIGGGSAGGTTLGGFDFKVGSSYDRMNFDDPQLLAIEGAENFTLTRSRVNGITSNNTLIEIFNGSNGVTISDSEFKNNTGGSLGPALIGVYDSGLQGARVTIRNNQFEENDYDEGDWYTGWDEYPSFDWTSMIRSVDSYVDITSNIMRANKGETLLQGVTTDPLSDHEFRILGNAIVDTTIRSQDLFTPGPLVHGFFQRHIMAVNNTIAGTKFIGSAPQYNLLFARGDIIPGNAFGGPCTNWCGSLSEEHARWDVHGNFVVNNQSAGFVGDLEQDNEGWGGGRCDSILGGANTGATYNWFFNSGTTLACVDSFANLAHNNIEGIDPMSPHQLIKGGDPTRPEYYSPIDTGQPEPNLREDGPDAFVTNLTANLSAFANGTDVRGDIRRNGTIDIGAYEFTPFILMDPIPQIGPEDSLFEFDINDPAIIQGGFPPYTAQIEPDGYPFVFGTHCDSRFASQLARGTSINYINASTLTVAYCPPRNFHTDSSLVVGGVVNLKVRVTDAVGSSNVTTVQYTITPVNDAPLTTTLGDNIPEGDVITASVAINAPGITNTFRLRPYVDMTNNFVFSEANNIDTSTNGPRRQVDYNFTYGTPTYVSGDMPLFNAISAVNTTTGHVEVNTLGTVLTESEVVIAYNVTDRNGNTSTGNRITVRAVAPPQPFNQLEPSAGFVVNNIDTLTGFRWQISGNSQSYDLEVRSVLAPGFSVPLFELTGLTAASPNMSCTDTCFLTLTPALKQLLTVGEYTWTVQADNQGLKAAAENAPMNFTVNTGRELIINGGFEVQGANAKSAADWKLNNGTGDTRKCPGGVNDSCFFELKAHKQSTAKLIQKLPGTGRQGDTLALSAATKSTNLGANKGLLRVVIKYTTGEKDKITLTAPTGTQNDFNLLTTSALQLRFPVKSYKVLAIIKSGKGKLHIDNVSLVLDEAVTFRLISPADNVTTMASMAPLTQFQWEASASAASYALTLTQVGVGPIIDQVSYSAAADADQLTCEAGLCVFKPLPALADGNYIWSVTASNGMIASNGPADFSINSGSLTELVVNGGFEDNTNKKLPRTWKLKKVGSSASVCASGTTHPEYQGNCAWQFNGVGSAKATLKQKLPTAGILANDRLVLRAAAALQKAAAGAEVKLQVKYKSGGKDVRKIRLVSGSSLWQGYEAEGLTVTGPVKKATLVVSYKGGGKVLFDNISVIREAGES